MEEGKQWPNRRQEAEVFFKQLEQWYYWMLAIPLIFVSLGYLAIESGQNPKWVLAKETEGWLNYLLATILLIDILFVHFYYKRAIKTVDTKADTMKKLIFFRRQSLLIYVAAFFYAMVLSLFYYLAQLEISIPLYMGILLYITFRRPSVTKAANDLKMTKEEYNSINYRDIPLDK